MTFADHGQNYIQFYEKLLFWMIGNIAWIVTDLSWTLHKCTNTIVYKTSLHFNNSFLPPFNNAEFESPNTRFPPSILLRVQTAPWFAYSNRVKYNRNDNLFKRSDNCRPSLYCEECLADRVSFSTAFKNWTVENDNFTLLRSLSEKSHRYC